MSVRFSLLTETEALQLQLIPYLTAEFNRRLALLDRRLEQMSDALDQTLEKLNTTSDQIVALLSTDAASLTALQASVDALKASQGDDSAEVAKAQNVLDKLTLAITPVPATVTPASLDPLPATDPAQTGA